MTIETDDPVMIAAFERLFEDLEAFITINGVRYIVVSGFVTCNHGRFELEMK